MEIFNNLDLLSVGVAMAANLTLGFVIVFSVRKSMTAKLFFCQTLVLTIWSTFNYLSYEIKNPAYVLFLVRSVLFFAVPNSIIFMLLVHTFPSVHLKIKKSFFIALVVVSIVVMGITLSPILFTDVIINSTGAPTPIVGPGIIAFFVLAILPIPLGIYYLIKNYLIAQKSEKKQIRQLLIGTFSMFLLIVVFDVFFPLLLKNTKFIPLSAVFTFPFVLFTAHAILRYKLFNVKIITTAILTFVLAIATFLEIIFTHEINLIIFRSSVFILVLTFGILLIKSVLREVEQREKIEKQEKELEVTNAKLGEANERLRELDKQKSEFVSMASHQLRSPLTPIKGYASLILDGDYGPVSDDIKHAAQIIFDSANTLAVVVSDYLNVTRIELGKMKYDFATLDLKDLVYEVVGELRFNAEKAGLKLDLVGDMNREYKVSADKEKLKQVLMNIVDNSVKYTPKGSITVSLESTAQSSKRGGASVLFAVKDTGVGIAPDVIPKLFGKFSRANNASTRDIRGTGLGLFIAKQIVEAHKGRVWVESAGEGKGSQFYLELPMVK